MQSELTGSLLGPGGYKTLSHRLDTHRKSTHGPNRTKTDWIWSGTGLTRVGGRVSTPRSWVGWWRSLKGSLLSTHGLKNCVYVCMDIKSKSWLWLTKNYFILGWGLIELCGSTLHTISEHPLTILWLPPGLLAVRFKGGDDVLYAMIDSVVDGVVWPSRVTEETFLLILQ